jgi:hypothetical protein
VLAAPLCELVEEDGLAFWSVVLAGGVVLDGFAF